VAQDLVELAYELSLRNLGQQEAALNELRARTRTVLTASAVVASFLGATAVARSGHGWRRHLAPEAGCILRAMAERPVTVPSPPPNLGIPETQSDGLMGALLRFLLRHKR
jgi:hypothetical protein